jgi:hypothetical protein
VDAVDGPRVESRPTLGIRKRTPFQGMLAERDRLLTLTDWMQANDVEQEVLANATRPSPSITHTGSGAESTTALNRSSSS